MRPRREIRGAVVVVTGASSGIGRATALAFAGLGARLVLAARDPQALGEVERACQARGAQVLVAPTDITDAAAVERLGRRAVERFGRVDVWVQAAATLIAGPLGSEPVEELRRLVEVNVVGAALSARAALATFRVQGQGTLVIVGSLLGLVPNPQVPLYSMTKYAARGLALNLRQAVAGQPGIEVCLVMPGPVDTPMFQRAANHTGRQLRAIPPAAAPERVAAAIVACARRPRRQTTAGAVSWLLLASHRVAPRLADWLVARWSATTLTRPNRTPDTSGALFAPVPIAATHGGWRRGRLRRRLGERLGTAQAQRQGRYRSVLLTRRRRASRRRARMAALAPGAPWTPPPGWADPEAR
jgi:short-subunit dehydrogenase